MLGIRITRFAVLVGFASFCSSFPGPSHARPQEYKARRVVLDGNTMMKRLTYRVAPAYPRQARREGTEGTVRLRVIIGTDGTVQQIRIEGGPKSLTESAVDAVKQWKYEPIRIGAEPVEVDTLVDVVFQLKTK